jgi:maleate isomerase
MYGWRKRIALIVPSSNTTCEMEFHRLIPRGVSVHSSRCYLPEDDTAAERIDSIARMSEELLEAAKRISSVEPDIIVWACTSGSFIKGKGHDAELIRVLASATNIPVITTSTAVLEAFKIMEVRNIAMATPYINEINLREKVFFEGSIPGLKIVNMKGLEILGNVPKGKLFPETAYLAGKGVDKEECDCVFISCTNWRTLEIIDVLERDLKKPVISSVQATIWLTFKKLSLSNIMGFGRLLEKVRNS